VQISVKQCVVVTSSCCGRVPQTNDVIVAIRAANSRPLWAHGWADNPYMNGEPFFSVCSPWCQECPRAGDTLAAACDNLYCTWVRRKLSGMYCFEECVIVRVSAVTHF
jgi:hypothetical protein